MRSLFLKILLWFGLVMVLVNVASFATGILMERRSQTPRQNPMASMFAVYAETAVQIFERDGRTALASYLERVESASHINAALLDERGQELSGRSVPAEAVQLADRVNDSTPFIFDFPREQRPLAAQRVRSERGSLYTLVAEMQRRDEPPPPRPGESGSYLLHLRMMAQHLLPVLLVGGLFCYLLARYLSTPIVKLRATTRALADGNLTARVDDTLLGRYDEIGNLGRDFNLMASRIEALVEAQRRLLGDISHELRSPLARQGVALGLARRRSGPEVSTALDRIGREAERINEMIGQLLTLSRAESGAGGLNKVKVDLCTLVQEVADDADFEARNRERSVRFAGCEACAVLGVPELLRSAVENVVRNAVRHTARGTEVEVNLHCERNAHDEYALISVRDRGPGVPEESLGEIFRPFYRVEDARDRQTGGTGLGLAITARAVRLHSGTIKASNASDGGLIVEIKLPLN